MRKILLMLALLGTLLVFASCGKETGAPEGMRILSVEDNYVVYIPERWVIDEKSVLYAHAPDYRLGETKAFYASVQVFEHKLDGTMDDFIPEYISELKSEFKSAFDNDVPLDYKNGEKTGKTLTYSIKKADGRELYKSTFIVHNDTVIELRYIAMEIDGLFEKNLSDYNMIVENIILK